MKAADLKIGWEYFPVEVKVAPLRWHDEGLTFTASGYGGRIPTPYMVHWKGRWRRVYVAQYSNAGTAYIGRSLATADAIVEAA